MRRAHQLKVMGRVGIMPVPRAMIWGSLWQVDKYTTLQWRHIGRDGVSNHQRFDCLFNRLLRRRSKTRQHQSSASLAFVRGNSPLTGEFPSQRASNAENVSIWWRHHERVSIAGAEERRAGKTMKQRDATRMYLHQSWLAARQQCCNETHTNDTMACRHIYPIAILMEMCVIKFVLNMIKYNMILHKQRNQLSNLMHSLLSCNSLRHGLV